MQIIVKEECRAMRERTYSLGSEFFSEMKNKTGIDDPSLEAIYNFLGCSNGLNNPQLLETESVEYDCVSWRYLQKMEKGIVTDFYQY